ncbi:multiubiquitin domain-containing protein [Sphingomonas abietis]|uniref:Multiubiquitin domain-containing protein n=1 Tax=Sphingomonas abietis TaxID=3012344 RepID=A0ABY7NMH9_9SPHN|nr:multiubiquitin domain-containing protein [Sphingomonas abietis]WBO22719.1 multiubiquitin domain-containing protein [Sphingomonas abietis]
MSNLENRKDEVVIVHDRAGVEVGVDIRHENGREIIEVDIEKCGRDNRPPPPHAHRFRIKIDHVYFVIEERLPTARKLLEIAGKVPPDKFELEKRMHGGEYVSLDLDEKVDLGEPGIEVFETFPLDETEG